MAVKKFADTPLTQFLERRILELKPVKTQAEIAAAAGFTSPNMLAMIKLGDAKLPLDRVPALAKALDVDPARLLQLALEQAVGDTTARALLEVFGPIVTHNELGWIEAIRVASDHLDPPLTRRGRTAILGIFGK
ncbi:XRE family transcriptional regulator [Arsenicitalea aurantiaca]|uniref:XRE family transcriptional regulator n=1 Tax=Arsenicitalea aurantiaca TaxID=1783274 RepID=A0A433X2B6_9HYPH|nr:helix-turn-helix transcriptional regulator [Arsenicitalea aurantiaca]RUT28235.1 XRE family transcriptional regulator [Arsenicitalea aurantiaca]